MVIFTTMEILRKPFIRFVFLFVTGITFVNLSFFMAEVVFLNLDKKDRTIQTIFCILNSGGFEEESEAPADSHEKLSDLKGVDLYFNHNLYHHQHLYLIAQQREGVLHTLILQEGFSKIFSPPPEA